MKLGLARLYPLGPQGYRAHAATPLKRGVHGTTSGALGLTGSVVVLMVDGGTTKEVFLTNGNRSDFG